MRALLDTHTLLWAMQADPCAQVSAAAWQVLDSHDAELHLSVASLWEMAIKASLGKLELPEPLSVLVTRDLPLLGIRLVLVLAPHTFRVQHLPFHHRDPSDRLLVAQCQEEGLTLLSADQAFDAYGIVRTW